MEDLELKICKILLKHNLILNRTIDNKNPLKDSTNKLKIIDNLIRKYVIYIQYTIKKQIK